MKAIEFIELTRKMRKAQKLYRSLSDKTDVERKLVALLEMNELQKQVDNADIEDPANLEIDFPKAEEI